MPLPTAASSSHAACQRPPQSHEGGDQESDQRQHGDAAKGGDVAPHLSQPARPDRVGRIRRGAQCQEQCAIDRLRLALQDGIGEFDEAPNGSSRQQQ
jgi:hypothetical protein